MAKTKIPAVLLAQPGAALEWHTVTGLPGHFHPEIPAPLGGENDPSEDLIRAYVDAHEDRMDAAQVEWDAFREEQAAEGRPDGGPFVRSECTVALTEVTEAEADATREILADLTKASRSAIRSAVRSEEVTANVAAAADAIDPPKKDAGDGDNTSAGAAGSGE